MEAIRVLLQADLRRRWRSWLALVLLVGAVGGVAMASVAAWQRTSTAMDRFVEFTTPVAGYVEGQLDRDDVEALPGVAEVAGGDYFLMVPVVDGRPRPEVIGGVSPFSTDNPDWFRTFERPLVIDGRLPDPASELEVAVDEELAEAYGVGPGDTFPMQGYGADQAEDMFAEIGRLAPTGPVVDLEVTAIVRGPEDVVRNQVVPEVVYLGSSAVFLGPAFDAAHRGEDILSIGVLFDDPSTTGFDVVLDRGATAGAELTQAVRAVDPEAFVDLSGSDALVAAADGERAIDLQAGLLLAFAALVGLGGLVLVSQAVRRQAEDDASDRLVLRALGVSPGTIAAAAVVRSLLVGLAGAVLAVAIAIALSPLGPVGYARRAEIDPGVEVRLSVLLAGAAAVVLVVVARAAVPAWRAIRHAHPSSGVHARVGLGDRAARAGLPAPVVAGVRAATLRTGGRTVVATVLVAAVGVVGGASFAASEANLATDPSLWGWHWDFVVGDGNDPTLAERGLERLADDPRVDAFALVHNLDGVQLTHGGRTVSTEGSGLESVRGDISPRLLEGMAPLADDEVALGGATAASLGVAPGDEVELDLGAEPAIYRVSGIAVMNLGFDLDRIGEGVLLTPGGIERTGGEAEPTTFLVDFEPGTDLQEAYRGLQDDWGYTVLRPLAPIDVEQLDRVRHLPTAFALLVGAIAAVTLAFVLTRTVRRGRRDLALLRTLGFEGRQLRAAVAAQATTLVLPAALVGALGGLIAGRVAWGIVADGLGAPSVPVVSVAAVLLVVVGALILGNLIAALPGQAASHTHPAQVLRAE